MGQGRGSVQSAVRSIGQGSTATVDSDSHAADEVAEAHGDAGPKQSKAGIVCVSPMCLGGAHVVDFGGEDDGHDDAVDCDDFAEDDGDEVLCSDSRGLDTATEN